MKYPLLINLLINGEAFYLGGNCRHRPIPDSPKSDLRALRPEKGLAPPLL